MKKRILSMLLAIVMVVGLLPAVSLTASAAGSYTYPTSQPTLTWTGTGTESDPYVINTAQELADLAWMVNNNKTAYNAAYYKLGTDIDLSGGTWTPIGYTKNYNPTYFNGHFDGGNHTISNLTIENASGFSALFGNVGSGTSASISNLTLSNVSVRRTNTAYGAAALVGQCGSLTISNCTVASGTITSASWTAAGIVASTTGDTVLTITNCVNKANITCTKTDSNGAGGFVGRGYNESTLTINGCTNYGNVTGYLYVGGIIGNAAACTVTRCANYGDISATGTVNNTKVAKAAGILTNGPTQTILIDNCYNAGTIQSDGITKDGSTVSGGAAGIAAFDKAQAGTIKNCHNVGTVNGTSEYGYSIAIRAKNIENCYYLNRTNINNSAATEQTADKFADGTVYKLLQDANTKQVWGQVLGTDSYPVFYNGSNKLNFHIHEWTYSLEGTDKIVATCSNTDGNCPDSNGGSVSIAAPESFTYAGEPIEAVVTNALADTTTTVSVVYTTEDGSELPDGKPVNVGSYTAVITLGEAEISVEYEIEKASLTITAKSYTLKVGSDKPDLTAADAYSIEGLKGSDTVSVLSKTPALRYDPVPSVDDMNTSGYWTSICFEDGITADNYYVNCESGTLKIVECVHSFTEYYLNNDGDTIYGTCSKDDCPSNGTVKLLTIVAPQNAVYQQGLYHNVSLSYDSQVEIDYDSIKYTQDGEEVDPVNAGTYTASITYQGVTASVTYTVAKRLLTITADNKTVYVGDNAPEYSYTVSGWSSNHDEEDEFSHKVSGITAVCENANLNRVGTYAITISGTPVVLDSDGNDVSANYELTTQDGTLTVKMYYIPIIPSNPTYPPVVDEGDNGDVSVSPKNPEKGDTVIIIPYPDEGYEVDEVIVTDKNGNPVEVIDNGDGTYSFVQPGGKVNIEVTFKEIEKVCPGDSTCPMYPYSDLDASLWYHDGIHYCIEHGLMQGIGNNQFAPNNTTTRAMIVTILWRLEGQPIQETSAALFDVPAGQWYTAAVHWASANGIVLGYGDGTFGPNDAITREQMVTIMFRYAQYKGYDVSVGENTNILSYDDVFDVAEYAIPAMQWACGSGMIQGIADGNKMNLAPRGNATRAQAAAILQRYCENVTKVD